MANIRKIAVSYTHLDVYKRQASICLKSGDTLQEIFEEAGFPEGVFLHFEISHSEVEDMIANPITVSYTHLDVYKRQG